ncbi:MAG TPA: hypothetical protein VII26_07715 [Candidatus Limnocylindria bacterium]
MPEQYVPYSAAWFTLSLINAGLAQGKGRSGFNWWLLSLFLGPFATLMIVAWPAVTPAEPAPEVMGRTQATIIGIVAILLILIVIGLLAGNFGSYPASAP